MSAPARLALAALLVLPLAATAQPAAAQEELPEPAPVAPPPAAPSSAAPAPPAAPPPPAAPYPVDPGDEPSPWSPPPPVEAPAPLPARFDASLQAGAAYRYAFHDSFASAHLALHLGADDTRWGGGAVFHYDYGMTLPGLRFEAFAIGPAFHLGLAERVRLDLGLLFGEIIAHRVTRDETFGAITLGVWVEPSYDLVRNRWAALFLGLHVGLGWYDGASAAIESILSLGFRASP